MVQSINSAYGSGVHDANSHGAPNPYMSLINQPTPGDSYHASGAHGQAHGSDEPTNIFLRPIVKSYRYVKQMFSDAFSLPGLLWDHIVYGPKGNPNKPHGHGSGHDHAHGNGEGMDYNPTRQYAHQAGGANPFLPYDSAARGIASQEDHTRGLAFGKGKSTLDPATAKILRDSGNPLDEAWINDITMHS